MKRQPPRTDSLKRGNASHDLARLKADITMSIQREGAKLKAELLDMMDTILGAMLAQHQKKQGKKRK